MARSFFDFVRHLIISRCRIHWVTSLFPCCCPAFQSFGIFVSIFDEYPYRTGTGMLVFSRAVGNDLLALGYLLNPRLKVSHRNVDRSFDVLRSK